MDYRTGVKCRLRTVDYRTGVKCRLRTVDYRTGVKMQTEDCRLQNRGKMQTEDCRLFNLIVLPLPSLSANLKHMLNRLTGGLFRLVRVISRK